MINATRLRLKRKRRKGSLFLTKALYLYNFRMSPMKYHTRLNIIDAKYLNICISIKDE